MPPFMIRLPKAKMVSPSSWGHTLAVCLLVSVEEGGFNEQIRRPRFPDPLETVLLMCLHLPLPPELSTSLVIMRLFSQRIKICPPRTILCRARLSILILFLRHKK